MEKLQAHLYGNWITENRFSVSQMTSKAITTPTLLIITGRNSMKGWPTLTWVSLLSRDTLQLSDLWVELARCCVKLSALC